MRSESGPVCALDVLGPRGQRSLINGLHCESAAFFQLSSYSVITTCAYDHTTLNAPVLVWSPKLSSVGPVQYLDGWPPGNHRCCRLLFFFRCSRSFTVSSWPFWEIGTGDVLSWELYAVFLLLLNSTKCTQSAYSLSDKQGALDMAKQCTVSLVPRSVPFSDARRTQRARYLFSHAWCQG